MATKVKGKKKKNAANKNENENENENENQKQITNGNAPNSPDPPKPLSRPATIPPMTRVKTIWITKRTEPFLDDFDVRGQIGSAGQFGLVYRCRRKSDRSKFAVKTINKSRFYRLGHNSQERATLLNNMQGEIDILRAIKGRHQGVINFESVYEDRHFLYIVMEECRGGELMLRLQERIRKQQLYTEPEAAKILHSVCDAIYFMHNFHRIVHCDLKPENILFATRKPDSTIKIVDFGMSQVLPKLRQLTRFVGTPYYTAPEILEGKYDHKADVWSIGVIMFLMLFGFPPFYVDKHKYYGYEEQKAIYRLIKKGFTPEIKRGYGPWFPKKLPVSDSARDLMTKALVYNRSERLTAKKMLEHEWIKKLGMVESNDDNIDDAKQEPKLTPAISNELQKFENDHKSKMAFVRLFRDLFSEMKPSHFHSLRKDFEKMDSEKSRKILFGQLKTCMIEFIKKNDDLKQANLRLNSNDINSNNNNNDTNDVTYKHSIDSTDNDNTSNDNSSGVVSNLTKSNVSKLSKLSGGSNNNEYLNASVSDMNSGSEDNDSKSNNGDNHSKNKIRKIRPLFDELSNIDDNTEIMYDDLLNVATNDYIIARDEDLYFTLRELDKDDDGLIKTTELKAKFAESNPYGKVKDIEKIIEDSNLDNEGKIDYELFLKTLHPSYDNKPNWFYGLLGSTTSNTDGDNIDNNIDTSDNNNSNTNNNSNNSNDDDSKLNDCNSTNNNTDNDNDNIKTTKSSKKKNITTKNRTKKNDSNNGNTG